ncbi:hypothetical protein D9M69_688510 [compost metagenome]
MGFGLCQEFKAVIYIVKVAVVTGGFRHFQHTRIGYAPLEAGQPERALLQTGIFIHFGIVFQLLPGSRIDHLGRGGFFQKPQYFIQ